MVKKYPASVLSALTIDCDEFPEYAASHGVQSVPTVLLVGEDSEARFTGSMITKTTLVRTIQEMQGGR